MRVCRPASQILCGGGRPDKLNIRFRIKKKYLIEISPMKVAMKYKLELRFKLLSYLQEYSKKKGQEMTFLPEQKCNEHARYHNVSKTEHGKVGVAHGSILQKVLELVDNVTFDKKPKKCPRPHLRED